MKYILWGWAGSWAWGIWWVRLAGRGVALHASWNEPLFAERYSHKKPLLRLRGWRLFAFNAP